MAEFNGRTIVIAFVIIAANALFAFAVPAEICLTDAEQLEIASKAATSDIERDSEFAIASRGFWDNFVPFANILNILIAPILQISTIIFDFFNLLLFSGIATCLPEPFSWLWALGVAILLGFAFMDAIGFITELLPFS